MLPPALPQRPNRALPHVASRSRKPRRSGAFLVSAPERIRTSDLRFRRRSLYLAAIPVPTPNRLHSGISRGDTSGHERPREDAICSHLVPTQRAPGLGDRRARTTSFSRAWGPSAPTGSGSRDQARELLGAMRSTSSAPDGRQSARCGGSRPAGVSRPHARPAPDHLRFLPIRQQTAATARSRRACRPRDASAAAAADASVLSARRPGA